jgi:dTDP-4-dehydrorhamnose 3,5-epimerase
VGGGVIDGVLFEPLHVIDGDRGAVLHMLRDDSPIFTRFGEIYFSEIQPGAIKAWKRHHRMTQRIAVPVGRVRFVLFDDRDGSATRGSSIVRELGRPDAYLLVVIPPGLWYGWQGLGDRPSLLANCADMRHDPTESEQADTIAAAGIRDWWARS